MRIIYEAFVYEDVLVGDSTDQRQEELGSSVLTFCFASFLSRHNPDIE